MGTGPRRSVSPRHRWLRDRLHGLMVLFQVRADSVSGDHSRGSWSVKLLIAYRRHSYGPPYSVFWDGKGGCFFVDRRAVLDFFHWPHRAEYSGGMPGD